MAHVTNVARKRRLATTLYDPMAPHAAGQKLSLNSNAIPIATSKMKMSTFRLDVDFAAGAAAASGAAWAAAGIGAASTIEDTATGATSAAAASTTGVATTGATSGTGND